jgi:HSP20 family molecular chaperone IbpA
MSNQNFDPRKGLDTLRTSLGSTLNRLIEDGRTLASNVANNAQSLTSGAQVLPVDMFETDTSIVVKAGPLIGVQPEKIDVSIVGDKLTIKGEISPDDDNQTANYLRRERRIGPFSRTVDIPRPVRADQAEASFKDNMLTILLPKIEEPGPKVINVKPVDS